MSSGVLGNDGNIYAIPLSGNQVPKINIANDTTSFIGDECPDIFKWDYGVLAQDGNIHYACPYFDNQVLLQVNIKSQTTNLVGPYLADDAKWGGFVEREDGILYGIPL